MQNKHCQRVVSLIYILNYEKKKFLLVNRSPLSYDMTESSSKPFQFAYLINRSSNTLPVPFGKFHVKETYCSKQKTI